MIYVYDINMSVYRPTERVKSLNFINILVMKAVPKWFFFKSHNPFTLFACLQPVTLCANYIRFIIHLCWNSMSFLFCRIRIWHNVKFCVITPSNQRTIRTIAKSNWEEWLYSILTIDLISTELGRLI